MRETRTSGLMSRDGKRSDATGPSHRARPRLYLLILPPAVAKVQGHLSHGTGWCCLSDMAQIPKGLPVRWFLIAFAVVLLGPVLALAAVTLSQYAASERTRYVEDGRKAARQIAADVDHELGKVQAAAEALATSPLIANGDYEAFQRQASKFLQTWAPDEPNAYAVILRDLNGQQLVNTRLPWGTPLPKVERDVDRLVITTKRPQVQDLFFSTSANRLMIAVRVPVLEDGGVTRVLSLALEPRRIAKLLQAQELSAEWNRGIVERNDRVVARWPEHDRFMGAQVNETLRRNAVGHEGVLASTNLEGIPVLVAYTRSELSGWRAVVGIPLSVLQGPVRSWQWSVTVLSLAGLILLIGLAFWFGRQIARPIYTLEVGAGQLAKGQRVSPVTTGLREIDAVGRALALASAELRERERALKESERRLRATYDNAAVGIIEVDQDGRILQANQTHCELMGYSREEIVGHLFTEVTHPDYRNQEWGQFSRQVKGELPVYTIEMRYIRHDGAVRWVRVSSTAVHDPEGRFYAVRVIEDITERKQAEQALRQSEARLRATYDNAAVGIIEVDQDGRILQANQTHCELMGYLRDELIGHRFTDVTHPDHLDRDWELFRRQVRGELPVYTIEKQHIRRDGALRWARVSSTAVHDPAGRFLYAVRVIEDITERKQAEERQRLLTRELGHRM